jgi:hypothetical protein
MIEIAKRAVACKGWRWMPGMLTMDGRRVVGVDGDVLVLHYADEHKCYQRWTEDAEPDLGDPATLGCLLALVREARNTPYGNVAVVIVNDAPRLAFVGGLTVAERFFVATTEAEALVAALEAAP